MMKTIVVITVLSLLLTSIECGYFLTSYYSSCGGSLWWDVYVTTSCHFMGENYNYYDCSGSDIVQYDCKDENCEDCVQIAQYTANKCIYGIEFSCSSSTTIKVPSGYIGELSYNNSVGCNYEPYYALIYPKNSCIEESPYLSMEYKCNSTYVDMYTCYQPGCPTSNSNECTATAIKIGCFNGNSTDNNFYEQVVCN